MNPSLEDLYREYRPLLFSIAYRMLGSSADAEEMVQETFVRAHQSGQRMQSPKSYLATVITRLCLDHMKSAAVKRTQYVGQWLPEPLPTGRETPDADSLSVAFLLILETMAPLERAVFLLREVFDYEFGEIAAITEKSEANVRQIFHRARQHVRERRPRFDAGTRESGAVLEQFLQACATGDMDGLLSLLAPQVTFVADGGGKAKASLMPVLGSDRVARLLFGLQEKNREAGLTAEPAEFNGLPSFVVRVGGEVVGAMMFELDGSVIQAIYFVANPDKLSALSGS